MYVIELCVAGPVVSGPNEVIPRIYNSVWLLPQLLVRVDMMHAVVDNCKCDECKRILNITSNF